MRPAIYERDLEKFTFSVETLLLVMVVELGKNCLKKRIGSIIKLTKQTLSSQIAIKKCESVVGNFYTEKCTDCR